MRIGIDVGGTNTDAVLIDGDKVIYSNKTGTTEDITSGVRTVLKALVKANPDCPKKISAVMIGTTHFINAVVQRRHLNKVAIIRVGLPASASLKPMIDWPEDLRELVDGNSFLIEGGHEYDGRPLMPLNENAVEDAAQIIAESGVTAVAISSIFSPLTIEHEQLAFDILKAKNPKLRISLSNRFGRIGLLERENVTILNASLQDLAASAITAFETAINASGIKAPLYVTQNDGTVTSAAIALETPVFGFASGPTNSMRGAAFLSGIEDAMVVDIGGTTSDVGCLKAGYPREANNVVEVGGVRTLFRMPDVLSIGIGGGTMFAKDPIKVGPQSVGHRLQELALVFGGKQVTLTDIAVAFGIADIGNKSLVDNLPYKLVSEVMQSTHQMLTETVDCMKTDANETPLLVVGGGAMLCPDSMDGISEVIRVPHAGVANAVGAAMAQISGEVDHVFNNMSREDLLQKAEHIATDRAIAAGADAASIRVVEVEDLPLAYIPGNAVRARVRVVGEIARGKK
ncbi:hydantoinase/oxoprolinase family protein [Candidatus Puniceispirillum sp.]|nr:hydantoinase/oxoprolinase family protein [Candidatus Puniceispirillum sp.]